jgi:hypothetical protein
MPSEKTLVTDFSGGPFAQVPGQPNPIQETVMPVVAMRGDEIMVLGTAFAISSHGLMLTARHVVDEAYGLVNGRGSADNEVGLGVLYVSTERHDDDPTRLVGGIFPIHTTNFNPFLDIAVMCVNLPVDTRTDERISIPALTLSPEIPAANTDCFALGYHKMNCSQGGPEGCSHTISQSFSASKGTVQNIHFPYRDKSFLSFPCFEVNSRFDAGMSGGPVLNLSGGVIGVVCSSIALADSDGHTSYASLTGPALLLQLNTLNPNGGEKRAFLHDFIVGGSVPVDTSIENLTFMRNGATLLIDFGENRSINSTLNT